jgi:hypothetical protein
VAGGATPAAVAFSGPVPAPSAPTFAESPVIACAPANMKDLERQHILDTLAKVGGSRKKAVALLAFPNAPCVTSFRSTATRVSSVTTRRPDPEVKAGTPIAIPFPSEFK